MTVELQKSIPDAGAGSFPVHETVRGALCQPAALGEGLGAALVVGGWVSYLITNELEEVLPATSVQLPVLVVPVVSGPP